MSDLHDTGDWGLAIEPTPSFDVPRFIRLFIIRRIISNYINSTNINNAAQSTDVLLPQLVSMLKDEKTKKIAHKILSRLLNDGIKIYMSKYYNEKLDANVIEIIFKNIILVKFVKKYQEITTYSSKYKYQSLVFNTDDLMRLIFQYLTFYKGFQGELHECSLVNSYWLYHIWSTKLIYGKYNITSFMQKTLKSTKNITQDSTDVSSSNVIRFWDRLARLKNVGLRWGNIAVGMSELQRNILCSKLSMLHNIEILTGSCVEGHDWILKAILQNSKQNIQTFDMFIYSNVVDDKRFSVFEPLELLNARDLTMRSLYFFIKWSKRCKALKLENDLGEGTSEWVKYITTNCDCSGIEYVKAHNVTLSLPHSQVEAMASNVAKEFCNLKQLEIEFRGNHQFYADCFMLHLAQIVLKNDGYVHLKVTQSEGRNDFKTLMEMIEKHLNTSMINYNNNINDLYPKRGISKLTLCRIVSYVSVNDTITVSKEAEKLLKLCKLEWLTLMCIFLNDDTNDKMLEYIRSDFIKSGTITVDTDQESENIDNVDDAYVSVFSSLKVIQTEERYCMMDPLLYFLKMQLDVFGKLGIFGIAKYTFDAVYYFSKKDETLIQQFEQMCKMVHSLLVNQIAIDIKLGFIRCVIGKYQIFKKYYENICTSYFNEKTLSIKYKQPKCQDNVSCQALKYPQVSNQFDEDRHLLQIRFVNVKTIDPWAQNHS